MYALDKYNNDRISAEEAYGEIPDTLITSINGIAHILLKDQTILDYLNICNLERFGNEIKYIIMILTLLDNYNPLYIFDCKWRHNVLGYINPDKRGDYRYFKITDEVKINVSGKILRGYLQKSIEGGDKLPIVIKCSYTKQLLHEMNLYNELRKMGCPVPWFSVNYSYWGHPVLIMEPLQPIDYNDDNVRNIGRNIIEQLRYVHKLGVHCDIKPMNIMKKSVSSSKYISVREKDKYYYYLIDYGGMTTDLKRDGDIKRYKRHTHTRMFTSQSRDKFSLCSAYNDLKELGYTLNYIIWKMTESRDSVVKEHFKINFRGIIKEYMLFLRSIKNQPITDETYEIIIDLFDYGY